MKYQNRRFIGIGNTNEKAEKARGYPDALDFNKAGISLEEYQAMLDVSRYLEDR